MQKSSYMLAKKNDAAYQQAYAYYRSQKELRKQAKAAILPSVSLDATQSETEKSGSVDTEQKVYSANLNQTIFDYRVIKGLKQAKAIDKQAEVTFKNAEQDLILRVTEAYFNVLSAQDKLRFAQAEKSSIEQQLKQSKQRYDIGLIAITDYKEAQANFDLSIAQEIVASNTLQSAAEALVVISNQDQLTLAALDKSFSLTTLEPQNVQHWVDLALKNNPSLLAALHKADASRHAISIQSGDRYPSLNFAASRNYTENSVSSPNGEYDTTLSLNLKIPLFEGGGGRSRTRQAHYNYEADYQAAIQQKRLTKQQARNAYQNIQAAISRSKAFSKAVESTKAALNATEIGYKAGAATSNCWQFKRRITTKH